MSFAPILKVLLREGSICLSEIWLKMDISDGFVSLHGHQVFSCDMISKNGERVALYVSSFFQNSESKFCIILKALMLADRSS